MRLSEDEAARFHRLYNMLLFYVNERHSVVLGIDGPDDLVDCPPDCHLNIRDQLYSLPGAIDSFVDENSFDLSGEDLDTIKGWRAFVAGRFFVYKYLARYTVFLDADDPTKGYGVLDLSVAVGDVLPKPPVLVEAVLLPFGDRIVHDGILLPFETEYGPGAKRELAAAYKQARERGTITRLPPP